LRRKFPPQFRNCPSRAGHKLATVIAVTRRARRRTRREGREVIGAAGNGRERRRARAQPWLCATGDAGHIDARHGRQADPDVAAGHVHLDGEPEDILEGDGEFPRHALHS
jgi:hypothetical protein